MVVLDTNVVSELMRDHPSREVIVWLDELPTRELFVTAVTEAEIRTGIAFLPEGRRRQGIADAAERVSMACFPDGFSRSTAVRRASTRRSQRLAVPPGARSPRPMVR